ncbi:hypothetical protein [Egicoccus sp. AB-alg2]|uniref:hypothetical protein n=1 Tax=Egicoccus sp. AB-alg2 TaxID=3242693 RepID=UPI00359CD95F
MSGTERDHLGLHVFCGLLTVGALASLWYFGTTPAGALLAVGVPVALGVAAALVMTRVRRFRVLLVVLGWALAAGLVARLARDPSGEPLAAVLLFPVALLWPLRWLRVPSEHTPGRGPRSRTT